MSIKIFYPCEYHDIFKTLMRHWQAAYSLCHVLVRQCKIFPAWMVFKNLFSCSILVALDYLGERKHFTPEQLMAMLIVDGKAIALTDNSPVTDCVIAVPSYFTMVERRAMLDASQIAGVQCLRLMQEITATALAFGIYKTDLPEKDPLNVVFVDVGYSSLQVNFLCCHMLSLWSKSQSSEFQRNWQ